MSLCHHCRGSATLSTQGWSRASQFKWRQENRWPIMLVEEHKEARHSGQAFWIASPHIAPSSIIWPSVPQLQTQPLSCSGANLVLSWGSVKSFSLILLWHCIKASSPTLTSCSVSGDPAFALFPGARPPPYVPRFQWEVFLSVWI